MCNIFDMALVSKIDILFDNFKMIWKNGSFKNKENLQNVKTTDAVSLSLFYSGADLIKLFPLLLLLRTGRTEIKCVGTSVLAYSFFRGGVDRSVT